MINANALRLCCIIAPKLYIMTDVITPVLRIYVCSQNLNVYMCIFTI